jgi:hypothetical protein
MPEKDRHLIDNLYGQIKPKPVTSVELPLQYYGMAVVLKDLMDQSSALRHANDKPFMQESVTLYKSTQYPCTKRDLFMRVLPHS